jgi:hypothetical protein
MTTTNYFRINHPSNSAKLSAYVFFDDEDKAATDLAFAQATTGAAVIAGATVSAFRPARHEGPWDECQLVGHRRRDFLQRALGVGVSPAEIREEIAAIDARFAARRAMPLPRS